MTQIQWQQLEATVALTSESERRRLAALLGRTDKPKSQSRPDPIIGLFADEPELIERIVKEAYADRESRVWRLGS